MPVAPGPPPFDTPMYRGPRMHPLWEGWFLQMWKQGGTSGTGGTGVNQLVAGSHITLTPVSGVGVVQVGATDDPEVTQILAGSNVTITPTGGQGIVTINAAPNGFFALDGMDGDEGFSIPGPAGVPGIAGVSGTIGVPGLDGADSDEVILIPGVAGPAGTPGPAGPQGMIGIGLDGADADDLLHIPGPAGANGSQGPVGPQGIPGIGLDGADADDLLHIPGQTGSTGAVGPQGIPGIGLDGQDADEALQAHVSLDGIVLSNIARLFVTAGNGTAVTVVGASGQNVVQATTVGVGNAFAAFGPSATQITILYIQQAGQTVWQVYQPASSNDLRFFAGADRVVFTATGAVNISGSPAAATVTTVLTGLAAFKPSDTTAASNVLTADATLSLTFNETGKYAFELWLPFFEATLGTGGFQFDLNSGTATVGAIVYGVDGFSTASVINAGITSVATATSAASVATSATAPSWFFAKGWLSITVAGTLVPRWAQASTLGADPTTLKTGAYFMATKIG